MTKARSDLSVHPYTRETAMIHLVFRRESRLLAELVQQAPAADVGRARVLAERWRLHTIGLHAHHPGEDEMLWPALLSHLGLDAEQALAAGRRRR
ncbi:hypothetical protein PUR59_01795 [Streptomyces sp. SP18ES09]|uniref:hypothetical protein n=1 Tax=Streptomyces sp. SP18ES09 TaxID=3002532 RepID=UPI002E773579|nr:hypothetical protein [Streptomyces sp. SP18ES09]MEE1813773.1 hypothetical protein [Streptomyces sp. SP18ES09]